MRLCRFNLDDVVLTGFYAERYSLRPEQFVNSVLADKLTLALPLYPQMTDDRIEPMDWRPRFIDYLYVSLTNATAFSPTDTLPLTPMAKSVMGVQALVSLVTIGLIISRAVNIL